MRKKIVAALLVIAVVPVYAIQREDVLECRIPDGSMFVLKSKYEWSPLARFFPHAAARINQEPYTVYYRAKNSLRLIDTGQDVGHSRDEREFRDICSNVGLFNGRPLVTYKYFEGGAWVGLTPDAAKKLYVQTAEVDQSEQVRNKLQLFDLSGKSAVPAMKYAFLAPFDERLLFEHPVTRNGEHVVAVLKSESFDNGKTWQELTITVEAKIFKIGKKLLDQPFIGQPGRFNGKNIK